MIPTHARVAVYDAPGGAFRLADYPLRPPRSGELLVKVRMATLCRSDIHTWQGHRPGPCPGLLGHEIIGNIVALGHGVERDMRGDPLRLGDRITWSEYFAPAPDYFSEVLDLPHKSAGVDKYGHCSADTAPHHHGGFAEYCYVLPRSWVLRLPDELSDEEATPINCGVATMVAAVEAAALKLGDTVVVQGLGLLGLYGAAIAKARGARRVIGVDGERSRREMGALFCVDVALDPAEEGGAALARQVRELCPPAGPDAVIEVCGDPAAIPPGLAVLRTGGTYVIAGIVSPGAPVPIDANLVLRKLLTLRGVHNYHPRHLVQALDFVQANRRRFPFQALVDRRYTLEQLGEAFADGASRKVLRAAVVPGTAHRQGY